MQALNYLKNLFWNDEKPNRREFLYMVLLLGTMMGATLVFSLVFMALQPIVARLGSEFLAAYSIFNSISGFSSGLPGIPWNFAVLLGSILLVRRVFGKKTHLVLQILGGIAIYHFFLSFQAIPVAWFGQDLFYGGNGYLVNYLMLPLWGLKMGTILNFLVGGVILTVAFFQLEPPESWTVENPFYLNRMDYLFKVYQLVLITLLGVALIALPAVILKWDLDEPLLLGAAGVLYLGVLVRSLQLMIRRMRHSRFSAHWLWGLFVIGYFLSTPIWIYNGSVDTLLPVVGIQRMLGWGVHLSEVLLLFLLFAPPGETPKDQELLPR